MARGTYEEEEKAMRVSCRKMRGRDHCEELGTDQL